MMIAQKLWIFFISSQFLTFSSFFWTSLYIVCCCVKRDLITEPRLSLFIALWGFLMVSSLMRCIDLCKSCFGVSGDAPMVRVKCFIAKSHSLRYDERRIQQQCCCHHQILTTRATRNTIWLKIMFSPQLSSRPFSLLHA